jgi:hypothetical protein
MSLADALKKQDEKTDDAVQEHVDALYEIKMKIDDLNKEKEIYAELLRDQAKIHWRKKSILGEKRKSVKFDGTDCIVTVSSAIRPKITDPVSSDRFIRDYGKHMFDLLFKDQVFLKPKGDMGEFLNLARRAGIPIDEFFEVTRKVLPKETCFEDLSNFSDNTDGIEAELYDLHSLPSVTPRPKKKKSKK